MFGRTFKALREFQVQGPPDTPENQPRHEGARVDLSACTTLYFQDLSVNSLRFLSCPNIQIIQWTESPACPAIGQAAIESLHDFLWNCPCLKTLEIVISGNLGLDSLFQLVLCDTQEQRVWRRYQERGSECPAYWLLKAW